MKVVIVDYGLGNLPNVQKALARVGCQAEITTDPTAVAAAAGVVLPGVGAFPAGMQNLERTGLTAAVRAAASAGVPVLGICLGMQLLFDASEEHTETPGLSLVPGRVTRLPAGVKLPQIGWNQIQPQVPHPLLDGLDVAVRPDAPDAPAAAFWAYFVHSFAPECACAADAVGVTAHGRVFPSVVARGNVMGAQFHPEKSSTAGLRLLANWVAMVQEWRGFTLFPAIDLKDGRAVRLRQGRADDLTDYGEPAAAARRWLAGGARALHVVDLDGAFSGQPANGTAIRAIVDQARAARVLVQLGGGLRSLAAIGAALDLGVSRAIIGTRALDGDLMAAAVRRFGAERVVAGIDARGGYVATEGWVNTTAVRAVDLAERLRQAGVRHCIYTDVSRDGMLAGPNFDAMAAMAATGMLVVASGGVSALDDLRRLKAIPGIAGAIAGKALYAGALDLAAALEVTAGAR